MSHSPAMQRYLESCRRFVAGETTSYDDYLHHLEVQNANVQTGPAVGERFPDFQLPDPSGRIRSLRDLSGPNGLLLVFVRSANWCGYCRNQLAELEKSLDDLRAQGLGLAAVAPDDHELVKQFAKAAALRYPLLADTGARFSETLGILNTNIPKESSGQNNGRVPFPGHYLLDADGRIRDKLFTDDLRHRASGTALAFRHFGGGPASTQVRLDSPQMKATISLSTKRLHMGQDLAVKARIELAPGWHAYGSPLPDGYTALRIAFEEDLVHGQRYRYPRANPMHLAAIGETLPVYEGSFDIDGILRMRWSAPVHGTRFLKGLRERLEAGQTKPGAYVLKGFLKYQLCDDRECLMPAQVGFDLPIELEEDVARAVPYFKEEIEQPERFNVG